MKQHQGIWFPDEEIHMLDWMEKNGELVDGKGTYQIKKLRKAVSYCKQQRTAVDIGAHVGLWSMQLLKIFHQLYAFEPIQEHRDCWVLNTENRRLPQPVLFPFALGAKDGMVAMKQPEANSTGSTMVDADHNGQIQMKRLDEFTEIVDVDFIKLDCEGYELFALQGGEQLIDRDRPVIIVEQKPGRAKRFALPEIGAVDWLLAKGYALASIMAGDYIMVPS